MKSIAEQWYQEGYDVGVEQGIEKGRQAIVATIRQVIAIRFYVELNHFDRYLSELTYEQVDYLRQRMFEVTTLAEFEAELLQQNRPDK